MNEIEPGRALFENGEPANLAAAALDALDWLDLLRDQGVLALLFYANRLTATERDESAARLGRAIAHLRTHVYACPLAPVSREARE